MDDKIESIKMQIKRKEYELEKKKNKLKKIEGEYQKNKRALRAKALIHLGLHELERWALFNYEKKIEKAKLNGQPVKELGEIRVSEIILKAFRKSLGGGEKNEALAYEMARVVSEELRIRINKLLKENGHIDG